MLARVRPSALFFAALLIFFNGCTERPHDNPFDPQNPETGGRPKVPSLISIKDSVLVRWESFPFRDIEGYNLYRKVGQETAFQLVQQFPPSVGEYWDTGAAADVERLYHLSVTAGGRESPVSGDAAIRPGPTFIWAIDVDSGDLIKYTHDGRHVIFRSTVAIRPTRLAVSPTGSTAWILDFWTDEIIRVDRSGVFSGTSVRETSASELAIDPTDNSVYVLSTATGVLTHYSESGQFIARLENLTAPSALLFEPDSSDAWVSNAGKNELVRINFNLMRVLRYPGFESTSGIAIDQRRKVIWAADSNKVINFRIDSPGLRVVTQGFEFARHAAVDDSTGECWIVDWSFTANNSRVVKLSPSAIVEFVVGGFDDPRNLAVDPSNGNCFVVDANRRELVEIQADGRKVVRNARQGGLYDVKIQMVR